MSGRKSFNDYYKNFTRISFPFSQTTENTKMRFFRSNANYKNTYYSFFFEDYLHIGGSINIGESIFETEKNEYIFGTDQVKFLLHSFFSFVSNSMKNF